jgi:hypothetical protein
MVALGYGRFVRAAQIVAPTPVAGEARREGRRSYVHLEGVDEPVVASRSHPAILADKERILGPAVAPAPRRHRIFGRSDQGERAAPTIVEAGSQPRRS